jgi:16S rRNA (adenine1518-N6/adenine1519-N6)-dimethyltransferase
MVLMFQKEVAQRIRAQAHAEDYGFLSVMAQAFWTIETVSEAGPGDFFPPPNVASRVLGFKRKDSQVINRQLFLDFVKAAFVQRRKLMLKNLVPFLQKNKVREEAVKDAVLAMGFTATCRAQEFSADQFMQLFKRVIEL